MPFIDCTIAIAVMRSGGQYHYAAAIILPP